MDSLYSAEAHLLRHMQHHFGVQHQDKFNFWSQFGNPYAMTIFFFPVLYNVDGGLGCKLIWVTCIAQWLNNVLKWFFHGHRPYWWVTENNGPELQQFSLTCETGPGNPSGHMMCSVAVAYCMLYALSKEFNFNKKMFDFVASGLCLSLICVGISRLYLAAHFPHQVITGAIAGYYVGRYVMDLEPCRVNFLHYVKAFVCILVIGGIVFAINLSLQWDPFWSVSKAEQHCKRPLDVRHKHNIWAAFVRCAFGILGLGVGLLITGDQALWPTKTKSWLTVVGSTVSVGVAQFAAHNIHIQHHQHPMFYSTVAAKAFGIAIGVVVIANICRRASIRLEKKAETCPPCPCPKKKPPTRRR